MERLARVWPLQCVEATRRDARSLLGVLSRHSISAVYTPEALSHGFKRGTARVSFRRTFAGTSICSWCCAIDLKWALPAPEVGPEEAMMYAAVTGAILVGVFAALGFRKAKQSREIYYFHEE